MKAFRNGYCIVAIGACVLALPALASAQYFGRNKVQYEHFDFRVLETPHYRLHFYPDEEQAARDMARMAERWNSRLTGLFKHQLSERKAILLYANQPDFQQTNAVTDQLTEGTGGVTEGLRDRLIMPLTGVYRDNDHVLGHEMVHVFQYDIAHARNTGGQQGLQALPLWVIEGIAEYLSLGRVDPHTAMWMRSAVLQNRLPTIRQLTSDPRFFPYRYGEALWAYVGGRFGDQAVAETYKAAARFGFEAGIKRVLGMSTDDLSREWIAATKAAYQPIVQSRAAPSALGRPLIPVSKRGEASLSPVLSPDGRYVAFFGQRDLFGYDLYLADAATGKSIKRLANVSTSTEFDALSFISSAGTWSPDGKRFAFSVYAKGNQELAILDVDSRSIARRIRVPRVGAIQNPAWAPDGNRIAFTGTDHGVSDLFVYDLSRGTATQLTNDRYADIQPSWSPDGRTIVFSTDRGNDTDFRTLTHGELRLALIDVGSSAITVLPGFDEAKHVNAQFSPDGSHIYFVSDHGGISDIYRMSATGGAIQQITQVATGISGITDLAPAFSISPATGQIAFSVFTNEGYGIYSLTADQVSTVTTPATDGAAGVLPPASALRTSTVIAYLSDASTGLPASADYSVSPYRAGLALAAIGQPSVGVSAGATGTYLSGATGFYFTDMLGNRNLNVAVMANGTVKDFGGQAIYQNVGHRFNWGLIAAHVPYVSGFAVARPTIVTVNGRQFQGTLQEQVIQRVYVDQAGILTQYPFSVTRRLELNATVTHLGFNTEVERLIDVGGQVVEHTKTDTTSAPSLNYGSAAVAFVGDNSFFGFTAPITGWRYRFEASPTFGALQFQTALADMRRYFFANPITFAVRGLHFGRYGADAESNRLSPVFLGDPLLVRGYSAESFSPDECSVGPANDCPEFDRLIGSRIAVANAELRIPLFGTTQYGLIKANFLPIDIAPFVDAGVAWTRSESPTFEFAQRSTKRTPVVSAGISARINLFGYAIGEAYYAKPFQRPDKAWVFGFNLSPGW